ncbi:ABC transporter ATP-binding protein/permease [bacterium]|nr:ABC transporter ATP-binding protein/permease [bacterium]
MENYTKQTFRVFWNHIKRYKIAGFFIVFSIMIGAITNMLGPIVYKRFFDILTSNNGVNVDIHDLTQILLKILAIYLIGWLFWRIATFVNSYFQTRIMADLSNTCFNYLHRHSVNFFNNNFVGSLVKRVNRFSRAFEGIADAITWELLPLVISVSAIVIVLSFRSLILGLVILVWVIMYCISNYIFSLYKLKYDLQRSALNSKVTGVLADTITNHSNIKLFTGHRREENLFMKVTNELQKLRRFCWDLGNKFEAVQVLLMIFLEIGIFYIALKLWQKQILSIGDFVLIQAYLITIFQQLWHFGRVIRHYYEHMADAKEMTEILETPHEIQDVRNAQKLEVKKGEIEFKDVIFSYHQTRRIFSKLNLTIKPQEKIALVGPSGSGKTSFVNLLLRNYDIEKGHILIDDQKISHLTQESIWKNISLVPQDPILFHRTLIENIRYGNTRATNQEVVRAAKLAYCDVFIDQLSEKYQTYVGERGVKLSGGERQRIAIARTII